MSFYPPTRILMGPGPSDVSPRVLQALARPTIGHLDPEFITLMDSIKQLLQFAFQTENALTLPISAPGSAGMETCLVNLVEQGDKVIICQNGVFGGRMRAIVERIGGHAVVLEQDWGEAVNLNKLEELIKSQQDAMAVAFVHAETSTGARSDAAAICALARENNLLSIMDTVTGLGGIEVAVDKWQVDATYSGTQKCLSCPPGLSPVTFSCRAQQLIKERKSPVLSWFLDLSLVMQYWGSGKARSYHHTAPVNALYGLHESLLMLEEEGLSQSWERHQRNHLALVAGLEAMGLSMLVPEQHRLPQLNTVLVPDGIDEARIRAQLLHDYGIEIGAGLGELTAKVWRIGLMGAASSSSNVLTCLHALEETLRQQSWQSNQGDVTAAANRILSA